jgi:Uma2 family endonuclease
MAVSRQMTGLMTAEELEMLPDDGNQYELIEGELIQVSPTIGKSGRHEMYIGWLIMDHVLRHDLGYVYSSSTGFIVARSPDSVLSPDVGFISRDRIPDEGEEQHFLATVPDLAIEVLSPSNRPGEMRRKARMYLAAGVKMIWIVDPQKQTVAIWAPDTPERVLTSDEIVDGSDVLPGFQIRVADLLKLP